MFFHNGQFNNLLAVINFYRLRDADAALWCPSVDNRVQLYDVLPPALRDQVNRDASFGPRPLSNEQEAIDLLCFLRTLSDGYTGGPPVSACL